MHINPGGKVKSKDFIAIRKKLNKTQQQIAQLLGVSVKAIESYEQGWRFVPEHAAKQMIFLVTRKENESGTISECWDVVGCPDDVKEKCPAWEFKAGTLCWYMNGTICSGEAHKSWREKIEDCRTCKAFSPFLDPSLP